MKKFTLTLLLLVTAVLMYANSLTVVNTTGCKYWISTDGGWFEIDPFDSEFIPDANSVPGPGGLGTSYDGDFHVVKVAVDPINDIVDVTESGPFTNTSLYGYSCKSGATFSVMWSWAGPNVVITIY